MNETVFTIGENVITLKEVLIILVTPWIFVMLHYLSELLSNWETNNKKSDK